MDLFLLFNQISAQYVDIIVGPCSDHELSTKIQNYSKCRIIDLCQTAGYIDMPHTQLCSSALLAMFVILGKGSSQVYNESV